MGKNSGVEGENGTKTSTPTNLAGTEGGKGAEGK